MATRTEKHIAFHVMATLATIITFLGIVLVGGETFKTQLIGVIVFFSGAIPLYIFRLLYGLEVLDED